MSVICSSTAMAVNIPVTISFQNILENKDIAMGEGASFFQDSDGFMWLGGGTALIRYDGYEFRQIDFVPDETKPNEREPVRYTESLFEDSHKTLWVASRGGILKYDRTKDELIRIKDMPSPAPKIVGTDTLKMVELSDGTLLAGTVAGLFAINPHTLSYELIRPKRVDAILVDGSNIWLGTETGLEKFNWVTKAFAEVPLINGREGVVIDRRVRDIIADGHGKLWISTASGLVHYDSASNAWTRYLHNPADRFSISSNDVWKLLLDSQGILWMATDGGGLAAFDQARNRFINHKAEPGRVGSLNSNTVRYVYEDRNNDLWVGNYPVGVNFFDRSSSAITTYANEPNNPNSLSNNSVLSVQEDKDGNLWLGTAGGGLNYFNREKGEFTYFKSDPNDPSTINGNSVTSLFIDSQGLIWTGCWGVGAASYDPATKKFTRYSFDPQSVTKQSVSTSDRLNSGPVWFMTEDKNHDMWFATHTGGISRMDRATKMFTHYTNLGSDPNSLANKLAWTMFEDSKGNFWVGTAGGLNLMDRERGTFTRFVSDPNDPTTLSHSSAITLHEDRKGRLWVGTDAGLNLFDAQTKTFTRYTKKDGFLSDHIRKILEDADGTLWISTNNGFVSFDPETRKIKTYNRIAGRLIGGFFTKSGLVSRTGEIIFGGNEGLRILNPKALTENKSVPPVVLTDFKIFSDSIAVGAADGILKNAINYSESITLDYKKSMFVFGFSALNFRDSSKNQYSYQLEGFDQEWIKPSNQRTAKYTNLDAGNYVFKVRASNNDGVWNEEGKSITIIQLPPPWKTWWAYTLYVLAILAIIFWFVLQQRRKRQLIEEQNRILELKVTERTAEVRAKSKDIESMLTNMPQGLFTVHEGAVIHPEYSKFLESIFETTDIAGRNVSEFLFSQTDIGSDALDSANAAIFSIVDEDEMNFYFNASLLVREYELDIQGVKKDLALDWNPIVENGLVAKLMVSVRDVTQLKQMEAAAKEQKRQLDIVSQLLNLSAEKYLNFEESSTKYVVANRIAVQNCHHYDEYIIALLFRNMHTIKGNCRTFGFTYLSNTVHEVESVYSQLKSADEKCWNREQLLGDLNRVEAALAEYADVYRTVLKREDTSAPVRRDGFWINNSVMNTIREYIKNRKLDELEEYVDQVNTVTLEQNLEDVIASLSSIATQIDKEPPAVMIEANGILIKDNAQQLISDIFAHILRNSVDHGLERAEDRLAVGKDPRGSIFIRATTDSALGREGRLTISIQDDGLGLNIPRLFSKGVLCGVWAVADRPSFAEVAELIFHSGVSTKELITEISGRGVGMDAVKQFLAEQGGEAHLKLHEELSVAQGYLPFELILTLPATLFVLAVNDTLTD